MEPTKDYYYQRKMIPWTPADTSTPEAYQTTIDASFLAKHDNNDNNQYLVTHTSRLK